MGFNSGFKGLISPTLQLGGGKKNTHGPMVMVEQVCTNFSFPRAVGEDTVNTYWRDSDFFSNCRA